MPPKSKMPMPIDRPLSRAYLRKFGGWSSAYPPGLSDPASLRIMENVLVNRDGSLRVRPGLRNLTVEDGSGAPLGGQQFIRGTHEAFYLNDGRKAYLFAVYQPVTNNVQFRVAYEPTGEPSERRVITLAAAGFTGPTPSFSAGTTYVKYLQIDNKILALSNNGEPLIVFYVGATKKVPTLSAIADPPWGASRGSIDMPSLNWVLGPQTTMPTHAVDFSSTNSIAEGFGSVENPYNFAFCYTFSNELGETAPSELAQFKVQRAWGSWSWNAPDTTLSGTQTTTPHPVNLAGAPRDASDQLSLLTPGWIFNAAVAAGATKVNFYVMSWSNQDNVPVELQLVGHRDLTPGATHDSHGWFMLTPATMGLGQSIPVPTAENRVNTNTTEPPRTAQGIVAADRLVLVNDPTKAAVIRWSTNQVGDYLNLSHSRGGGYKTLTSGNMQIPACVKLWQNPQSADTLTVLNVGTDGYSTSYYMAPATVTSQSDNTNIMGFEETTATPGTVSPYGCEVFNNALYHPVDDQLMKSTASNYNIGHRSQTDLIANRWRHLRDKKNIVSCVLDNRLYYLVHNPLGAPLEDGCWGNEIWVLDGGSEGGGSWSRWLVQGQSLRKIEVSGREALSLIRPDGIFWFDEYADTDDVIDRSGFSSVAEQRAIPWRIETNTQGANRAHDAWAHLQQVVATFGNLTGTVEFGIRSKDIHGKVVTKKKIVHQPLPHEPMLEEPFDMQEPLQVRRDLMEWHFFAGSVVEGGEVQRSFGQLNLVQYRYTPVSVNVGYEQGSVETFEYGRDAAALEPTQSVNGVPQPLADTLRP